MNKCVECGEEDFNTNYVEPTKAKLIRNQTCFHCDFWLEKVGSKRGIVINGTHYMDAGRSSSPFRGFGGREFKVLMNDGRVVDTNNLWCQGRVPERFKDRIPDNARWSEVEKGDIGHGQGYLRDPNEIP